MSRTQESLLNHYKEIHDNLVLRRGKEYAYNLHHGLSTPNEERYRPTDGLHRMTQYVLDMADVQPGDYVLDAGCGVGSISFQLAQRHPDAYIVGANLSFVQLDHAETIRAEREIKNVLFCQADYNVLPFGKQFDKVLFVESISHSPDIEQTISFASKTLKENGKFILLDHAALTDTDDKVDTFRSTWMANGIVHINSLQRLMQRYFRSFSSENLTPLILPSVHHLAYRRLTDVTQSSMAKGAILLHELLQEGKMGYFSITATK